MADSGRASKGESAGGGPSKANEDAHQIAARIAQAFRDAEFRCELLDPAPTETAFGTLLQRDRIVVALSLTSLIAVTWSYLLWLTVDTIGGMDIIGFRMIPAGMGIMMLAHTPWRAMEFAFVFAMWTVMIVGMMTPSAMQMILMYARVGRHTRAQGRHLLQWFGLLPAISLYGSLSRCSPRWCNGRLSVPPCSIPRWQPLTMSLEDWC